LQQLCKGQTTSEIVNSVGKSVQRAAAAGSAAVARNLVVFEREFVVVRYFFADVDVSPRVDDDLFQRFNGDDLGAAVRLKRATIVQEHSN